MEQYTLSIKETSKMFGFPAGSLYNMISDGKLIRSHHYLKVGSRVLIKQKEFIEWLEEQDGCQETG